MWYNFSVNNRDYKEFASGEIYHVYNRGVGKMNIFVDEQDFKVFLFRLKENLFPESIDYSLLPKYAARRKTLPSNSFDLISYCLMPNHFHLLIRQNTELSITQLILKVCTGYSKYFNKKYDRVGSLFQDKFKAVRINRNEQLLWTSFYIHENPKKALLVSELSDYFWSSYRDYAGLKNNFFIICKTEFILSQFNSPKAYLEYFKNPKKNRDITNKLISVLDLTIDNE